MHTCCLQKFGPHGSMGMARTVVPEQSREFDRTHHLNCRIIIIIIHIIRCTFSENLFCNIFMYDHDLFNDQLCVPQTMCILLLCLVMCPAGCICIYNEI